MPWPDFTAYHEALQHPARYFGDDILKQATIEKDRFGMPKPATGANAVVYRAMQASGEAWAVRCFLRPITDQAERYDAISQYLGQAKLPYSCQFHFLPSGVKVKGAWYPVVKMQWVGGELLHKYIERNLEPHKLRELKGKWRKMMRHLEMMKIAHGDLQQGNILVKNEELVLVDYDGMWVPALKTHKGTELGHRAFQHPNRKPEDYGPTIDRFSAAVIYLSLTALERKPELWEEYHNGDNLLFSPEDFLDPASPIWSSLTHIRSAQVDYYAHALKTSILKPLEDMQDLETLAKLSPPPLPEWISSPSGG